ncbi:phage tail assembly protein [Pasteurellaceae bacterium HPA106]|uniref:phage tail assembly protein n=1 Tax=Spirabiliibacterium pneumoniae TaxID=221400 RepID=UPI001AADD521|nr:phage tail assembly protein [Spirabiliibacterium pneumoniae]MBE2896738.1 phage tail assembly protein [Spirabiliibacterium pneumoniae]
MAKAVDISIFQTIALDVPFKDGEGNTVTELKIRRAKVVDMREANRQGGNDADIEIALLARLTGLVPEDFNQMDMTDYFKLQKAFMDMQKGKSTSTP